MDEKAVKPRDAAAVILLKSDATPEKPEICWVKRHANLSFLPGFHAFPGGKLEKSDYETPVENCAARELAALIACAAREAFEETGVLLARGGDKLTKGQLASLHDDLSSGRETFGEILAHWNLRLDARDFEFVGSWITPPFSPVRFNTRFFVAVCPPKQKPFVATTELETVEFIDAKTGLEKWRGGEILCAPPILNTLRIFSAGLNDDSTQKLSSLAEIEGAHPRKIEFNARFTCFPLRTKTLPPATHTNCFVVGRREFIVVDAASREASEQAALHEFIDSIVERGGACKGIVVSHSHPDHTGGETALQKHLAEKHNQNAPILCHRETASSLPELKFDAFLKDGDRIDLSEENGDSFGLEILHAPGHAPGHLCFYDREIGFLLSSDNVVGSNSVLIAAPEGNLQDYLNSLQRLKDLPNLRSLCGSHGAASANARAKIESYIEHRLRREQKILAAIENGARTTSEIVEQAYTDVKPELWQLAEKSVEAHLEKLRAENLIR